MNVFFCGQSCVRELLEAQLDTSTHRRSELQNADLVIDCAVQLDPEPIRSAVPISAVPISAVPVLALCYASSATWYASRAGHPEQVIGFSCVPTAKGSSLIELCVPLQNAGKLEFAQDFFASLGMQTITVPDSPGLIVARTIACLANEAFSALASGVADAQTINTAMRLGTNYPFGPLQWAELIGLKDILTILEGLHAELGEQYRPHPLLRRLVMAGISIETFEKSRS
jgi:3-hydroxybutyryl-CoA dehydrogenase